MLPYNTFLGLWMAVSIYKKKKSEAGGSIEGAINLLTTPEALSEVTFSIKEIDDKMGKANVIFPLLFWYTILNWIF